ncbi:RNase A-like domain-containing protein [Streptomyces sp. bgisy031]|uniref:RNase A-like domain-containing protein n=1 Tax=Streptomyces sp. bgisy031 TaxID=3413772 RepID=UPI003D74FACA
MIAPLLHQVARKSLPVPGGGQRRSCHDGQRPTTSLEDLGLLIKGDGEPNAWPRSKRKGAYRPKYGADLAGDEGKGTATSHAHTLERHVEVSTQDLRGRLRGDANLDDASRYVDQASAQKHTHAVVLKHQKEIEEWLNNGKPAGKKDFTVDLGEATGLSLSRSNFRNGLAQNGSPAQPWC